MVDWDKKYEEEGKRWGDDPSDAAIRFVNMLPDTAKYILDVGCGYGRDSLYFASKGYQVTGVDPSTKAVELAFSSVTDPKMNIEFFPDDCTALSFPSENVDAVWSSNVVHLLEAGEERSRAVEEMTRVLKPGGILGLYVLSTSDKEEPSIKTAHKFTRLELEKLFNALHIIALEEIEEEESHTDGEVHHHIRWFAVARKR